VRAEVRSVRLKGLSSVERKAAATRWKAEEALLACSDLIGGRVVCNNIEDVYRLAELLKERLGCALGEFAISPTVKDPDLTISRGALDWTLGLTPWDTNLRTSADTKNNASDDDPGRESNILKYICYGSRRRSPLSSSIRLKT
jgi:Region found in RelA / SpoT proteins